MYIENFASKVKAWGLSHGKKGSRLQLCFWVIDDVPEKEGMDLCMWKQMSSSKCSFTCICRIFLPLNPSMTTVYARSTFYPSPRFTLSLQSAFYTQSAFYPWSAVGSPQSAVCVLHWLLPNIYLICFRATLLQKRYTNCSYHDMQGVRKTKTLATSDPPSPDRWSNLHLSLPQFILGIFPLQKRTFRIKTPLSKNPFQEITPSKNYIKEWNGSDALIN